MRLVTSTPFPAYLSEHAKAARVVSLRVVNLIGGIEHGDKSKSDLKEIRQAPGRFGKGSRPGKRNRPGRVQRVSGSESVQSIKESPDSRHSAPLLAGRPRIHRSRPFGSIL